MASEKSFKVETRVFKRSMKSRHKIELPKFITEEELDDIITQAPGYRTATKKRHSIRASSLADVNRKSHTPTHKKVSTLLKSRASPYDDHEKLFKKRPLQNTENLEGSYISRLSLMTNKYRSLKAKNLELEEEVKVMGEKHKDDMAILRKEIERLRSKNKIMKSEHFEYDQRLNEEILNLRRELEETQQEVINFIDSVKQMLEKLSVKCNQFNSTFPQSISETSYWDIEEAICGYNISIEELSKRIPRMNLDAFLIGLSLNPSPSTGETQEIDAFRKTASFQEFNNEYISPSETLNAAQAVAIFNYKAENPGELDLKVDDKIVVLKQQDDGWWLGKTGDKVGIFPCNFVNLE
ncbi:unnamed protein product [Blepharisma stoltei]|uniref:SH3 domain-containing protein n=1 Tax=Blepharisma stoltei TaxID=1481888 RepID=A0AAU9K237_9CILI|nr:unnamed protein product [Blepharisma stoltei]